MELMKKEKKNAVGTHKATMADVAHLAGVSAATVARVLYKNGYVKSETRNAVENAVAETGYRTNMVARGLRTKRSFTLGLVISKPRFNAVQLAVAHNVQIEALRLGYTVLTINNNEDSAIEAEGVRRLMDHHVEAVIFATAIDANNVRFLESSGIPTVQVERQIAKTGALIAIDSDDGMRDALDHLVSLGHQRIAYIGGIVDSSGAEGSFEETVEPGRERLFLQNLARHGLAAPPAYIRKAPYYVGGKPRRQPAHAEMLEILSLDPRPTALVCGSDLIAASALQAINESDLHVPGDISVIGYDDALAEILTPALSSIAQPIEELGRLAVQAAIAAIDDPQVRDLTTTVKTSFVLRESTGPLT